MILHTAVRPRPRDGDLIGLHPGNTAAADTERTYQVSAQATPAGTWAIWHADPAAPGAADWAALIRADDVRYLIRATPRGPMIWRCPCCHRSRPRT